MPDRILTPLVDDSLLDPLRMPCDTLLIQMILSGWGRFSNVVSPQPVQMTEPPYDQIKPPLWRCGPYRSDVAQGELLYYVAEDHTTIMKAMVNYFRTEKVWLQEPWLSWEEFHENDEYDDEGYEEEPPIDEHTHQVYVAYEATPRKGYRPVPDDTAMTYLHETSPISQNHRLQGPWRPANTMPSWASRLALGIENVKVQRLHETTEEEASRLFYHREKVTGEPPLMVDGVLYLNYRAAYAAFWDSLALAQAKDGKKVFLWEENPWIVVYDFVVLKRKYFGMGL